MTHAAPIGAASRSTPTLPFTMSKTETNPTLTPDYKKAPAADWIRALDGETSPHGIDLDKCPPDTIAAGYAELLFVLAEGLPAFLETDAGHVLWNPRAPLADSDVHPSDVDQHRATVEAALGLLSSAHGPAFLEAGEGWIPYEEAGIAVALGFHKTRAYDDMHECERPRIKNGHLDHRCSLTGRTFWAPVGAVVPVLFVSRHDDKTAEPHEVHPDLVALGRAAIARALWGKAIHELREAAASVQSALWAFGYAANVRTPEDLTEAPPEWTYRLPTGAEVRARVFGEGE